MLGAINPEETVVAVCAHDDSSYSIGNMARLKSQR
jgi:hypothetical protein